MPRRAAHRPLAAALLAAAQAALLAAAAPAGAAQPAAAPPPPTGQARFTAHGRFVAAKLSPKGTWIALVSEEGGLRSLSFVRVADRSVTSRVAASPGGMVGDFHWADEERVVAELWELNGTQAKPVSYGELLSINPETATTRPVFGWRAGRQQVGTHLRQAQVEHAWAEVVGTARGGGRQVLIGYRPWNEVGDKPVRLARLDVYTGLKTDVGQSPLPNATYLTDEAGEARLAYSMGADAKIEVAFRDEEGWRPLAALPGLRPGVRPWHFSAADRALEVVEEVPGGFGLFSVAIDGGERRQLATTRLVPPTGVLRDQATGRPLAVESEPDLPEWQFLDEAHPLVKLLAGLLDAFPGRQVRLVSQTDDQRLAIAYVYGDRDPGRFLLVDVAGRTAERLQETRPWIDPEAMAEMTAFHIKASDGQPLHGYVTSPPGLPPGARPPLVVLPHGGPFGERDRWSFDPEVQLLASEGFAVLQVNYRGSGGYGDAYQEAGHRRWGDRMVEDLLDATRWLVRKGKVDGARICTYGASFGGYAAVQAAILAPDLFRCAAGFAGVYDLTRLERNDDIVTSGRTRGYVRTTTGDDEAALRAASPALHADRIKVPLLLMHGGKDTRVPIVHAERLRDALTALGRPPEWLEEPLEGHGFYAEEARARMYARLVAFLKQHTALAAAAAPPAPGP